MKKTVWQREKETHSVSFSPIFACEWIHAGHWSCFLMARLSSWIYVNWPCLRQPLKDISLLESEGRQGCRPSWASSCVGGAGQGGSVAGYNVPQTEHSPSGSNSSIMCDSCGPFPVAIPLYIGPCDVYLYVWICVRALLQHLGVCTWLTVTRGNPMQPLAQQYLHLNQHNGMVYTVSL